jgi:serine phosphatase RsbU (regulator of sigma subunit)
MDENHAKKEILKWTEVIYRSEVELIHEISSDWINYRKIFIDQVAEYLYEDIRRARMLITSPFTFNNEFRNLTIDEKEVWYNYASQIPEKLKTLNLFIRPFTGFCSTCLITDSEIERLACFDHEHYLEDTSLKTTKHNKKLQSDKKSDTQAVSFQNIPGARKWYFKELNYLIPPQLKKIGYEIIRPDEDTGINTIMLKKLAKAVHARYLQEMRNRDTIEENDMNLPVSYYPGDFENRYVSDFDTLPDDIKYSNRDNAYHITTKLLSIGYKIRPVQKGFKSVTLNLNDGEIETMAGVEHLRWSWDKRLNGWIFGNIKDNSNKIHPGLIPFSELTESEKEKDRQLIKLIPSLLQDIGYEAYHINPERIRNLSYAIKPQSSIYKLLNETRQLNVEIKSMASTCPGLDEKIRVINKKIEETISEVQGSYDYARHIQETFLPDDLFIRECFPDSFVLYKPKDIVSGDFYFFSKNDNLIFFAAADCTGHGIPGALLSTIGYGITDQAVNEIKLKEPSQILNHLYSKVHRFLRQEEDGSVLSDDMDIIMCSFDIRTNLLAFAGVKNILYHVSGGEITSHRTGNFVEYNEQSGNYQFISEEIRLKVGDTIYLCTDGYTDQFGGMNHKKYLSNRFKNFLIGIRKFSMPEQSDRLYEEIEKWREENNEEQTDDILVIGIRI